MAYKNNDKQTELFNYLHEVKSKPFVWGKWDCCRFVDGYIKRLTGYSAIPNDINWTNEKSALKAISKLGKNFPETITNVFSKLNLKYIKKSFLQAGDILLIKDEDFALGIYDGKNIKAVSDDGLVSKSTEQYIKGWRLNV